jgi:hypothetical protein
MGMSETILAAMIGAVATVSVAIFQLFVAFKSSDKADPRAKRGSRLKSLLSIAALMVASAVGGFLYSEFLRQRGVEQMQAMHDELREVKELAALTASRLAASPPSPVPQAAESPAMVSVSAVRSETQRQSEALVYVPRCQPDSASGTAECLEGEAQRVALCGAIPVPAQVTQLQLFAQPDALQQPWDTFVATLEQDLGGARFTGSSFEYAPAVAQDPSAEGRAVCVNFMHWNSAHPHLARLVVHYDFAAPQALPAAAPADVTVLTDQAARVPQAASFISASPTEAQ